MGSPLYALCPNLYAFFSATCYRYALGWFAGKVALRQERTELSANGIALAWQSGDILNWGTDFPPELQRFTEDWQPWITQEVPNHPRPAVM